MTNSQPDYNWTSWKQGVEFEGQALVADKLDRAQYAKFLTGYLNGAGQRDGGYVINLNAEWGAGKTWFLKRWCATLKPHHPVAYIDAWKNDFSDDPLLTVVSGVLEALKQNPHVRWIEREQKLFSKLGQFVKLGVEVTDVVLKANGINGLGEAFGILLSSHQKKSEGIDTLRSEIRSWLQDVTESPYKQNIRKPMYVFIDELDRCRPTYAIELLETVKHLFEIQDIVFVIATNTDQLQHSIRAVYGEGFDANRYLYRFFNRSFALAKPALKDFIASSTVTKELWRLLEKTLDGDLTIESEGHMVDFFTQFAEGFQFDLRTTLQWLDQCEAVFANPKHTNQYFWPYLVLMIALKLRFPEMFDYLYRDHLLREFGTPSYWEDLKARFESEYKLLDSLPEKNKNLLSGFYLRKSRASVMGESIFDRKIELIETLDINRVGKIAARLAKPHESLEPLSRKDMAAGTKFDGLRLFTHLRGQYPAERADYVRLVDMAYDLK